MVKNSNSMHDNSSEAILNLLEKHRLLEGMIVKQDTPKRDLVQHVVRKQNLARLKQIVNHLPADEVASIFDVLTPKDQLFIWDQIQDDNKENILQKLSLSVLEVIGQKDHKTQSNNVKAFAISEGRLKEISVDSHDELFKYKPVWVDLVNPSFEDRALIGSIFNIEMPDPEKLSDLESSAKYFIEEGGEVHLRSNFLLDRDGESRSIPVAFILHGNTLFSICKEELPVFRLQRLRALTQQDYVSDAKDLLLDLYAADVEYSADTLEDVYRGLETAGNQILNKHMSDDEAAKTLTIVAHEEDLNGRIRRNVLDTRRAVSFLMRSRLLKDEQVEDSRQILRDIESLDGHTAFLFDKINFLMDATVGFININQNKVIKRLTVLSVVFMPLNVIAGIGGMSEFSMMTSKIPWQIAYPLFTVGLLIVAWLTFELLRFFERREIARNKRGK